MKMPVATWTRKTNNPMTPQSVIMWTSSPNNTCVPLVVKVLDRGIHYVGTARQMRLPNCNLEEEKSLKKKGRGSFDIRVEANHSLCAVKWYESRALTLVSSFAGPDPVQRIQRWDKANKTYTLCREFNAGTKPTKPT
ncbi:piggyBac transposable element-derived protein 2-like [Notothenia coriiceps]|uniref:PiggyBac transposable element-derived protein 2-like n=1 Tax=Notothenia coriiceps TaxID=8208 RepID=A0A6I9P0D9_9TELE|nr:PREDICTED: piggyBac transposable element-derived protein 2-like [Notothenia coriiceps]